MPHGLSQHIAKIGSTCCHPVLLASLPQSSLLQSSFNAQASLTLTANSALSVDSNPSLGNENPSGHNGTYSDLPVFSPGDMDDCKFPSHQSKPYTKPITAMIFDDASNSANDAANDQAGDMADDNDVSDTTNIMNTDVFEIIT